MFKKKYKPKPNHRSVTKWYQSNPATVADCVFSAPSGGKNPKTRSNEEIVFLSGG